jgi:hypothetical protein
LLVAIEGAVKIVMNRLAQLFAIGDIQLRGALKKSHSSEILFFMKVLRNLTKPDIYTRNIRTTKHKECGLMIVTYCLCGVTENTQLLLNFTVLLPRQ